MVEIRAATLTDAVKVYELLDAPGRKGLSDSVLSPAAVAADFQQVVADRWVAVHDETLVGFAKLSDSRALVVTAGDPTIGDELYAEAETRARERGYDAIEATVISRDAPFEALVARNGFARERDVLRMWRLLASDVPTPTWAQGTRVRTYEDDDALRVHTLLDEAYTEWDTSFVPVSHEAWLAFMTGHDEFDPEMWFLVERNGELVACALHWKEHQQRGWVKDLAVRASERGLGLGKALLHHGFCAYAERDAERVGLKVDAANPTGALDLYARVGFETDQRYEIWKKQL